MKKMFRLIAFLTIASFTVNAGFDLVSTANAVDPQNREIQPSGQGCGGPIGACNY